MYKIGDVVRIKEPNLYTTMLFIEDLVKVK